MSNSKPKTLPQKFNYADFYSSVIKQTFRVLYYVKKNTSHCLAYSLLFTGNYCKQFIAFVNLV